MRIVSIELNGFRRMALNGIKHFKLTPNERIQLILGSNGSGKSSLIAELSPLPAAAANYLKDGSKIIQIDSAGNKYLLTSDFTSKQTHSFIKNDEELNEGGTASVQKELVRQEFGITPETHDVCTGVERFTTMSPSRRRELFTQLCDTNFDYALGIYARAREAHRDTIGALKNAKKRLVTETAKLAQPAEVDKINSDIKAIVSEIDILYRNRSYETNSVSEIESERESIEAKLLSLSRKVLDFRFSSEQMFMPEELQQDIDFIRADIAATQALITENTKEYSELKDAHDAFLKTGNADVTTLRLRVSELQAQRDAKLSLRKLGLEFTDIIAAKACLDSFSDWLPLILVEFPENSMRTLGAPQLEISRQKLEVTKNQIADIQKSIDRAHHVKSHLDAIRKGDETQCPKCEHKWHVGFNQLIYNNAVSSIESDTDKLEALNIVLKSAESEVLANEQYMVYWKDFLSIVKANPILQPFWDHLKDHDVLHRFPRQALTKLDQLKSDIDFSIQAHELDKEINRQKDLLDLAIRSSTKDMSNVTQRLETTEKRLGELASSLGLAQKRLQSCSIHLNRTREFLVQEQQIKELLGLLKNSRDEMLKAIRNEIIQRLLNEMQIELARRQNLLNDIKMQQGIVDDIAEQVKKLETQETVYKLIANELSPTDGLIAEGLLGFIRVFIKKMNSVIKKIWSYRLEVQDCSVGSGDTAELDYKFPLLVGEEGNTTPDVGKASQGQMQVVDLAFRIVATNYYGLNDSILTLDEFGSGFDSEHRATVVQAIKQILEQISFSQLFMVSHFAEHYGAFTNTEICVIGKTNTVIPSIGSYNKHVTIS